MKKTQLIWSFVKPEPLKFLFWVEWVVFCFILFMQGKIQSWQQAGIAAALLVFFYLTACILFDIKEKKSKPISLKSLLGLATGFVILDQGIKLMVLRHLPVNASFPVIPGWFEITHRTNQHGAWILTHLSDQTISWTTPILLFMVFMLLFLTLPVFRYARKDRAESFWLEASFVLILASLVCWPAEMLFRGRIIDFIGLPGLVAADTKDLYLTIGTVCFVLETIENPNSDWHWRGWKNEWASMKRFFLGVWHTLLEDLKKIKK